MVIFEMHSNTVEEQVEFRVLPGTKTCKSACYDLQGLQVAWCSHCISSVNSKDLPWYSRQALCNSFSVYATSEPKEGGKEELSLTASSWRPCVHNQPYMAWHQWDYATKQPNSLKQVLGEMTHIWMCFPRDQSSVGALNSGQLSWETQTFSLLTRSRLMQQAEGMVTLALLPLPFPCDCSVNHAKELIQATNNAEQ